MDLFTIIIAIVGLSIFLVPVVLDYLSKKKKSQGFEKEFLDLAKGKKVKITTFDIWGDSYAIGLDRETRELFYLNKQEGKEVLIDLTKVKKCRISKTSQSDITSQVSLTFTFLSSNKPEERLEFYSKNQDQNLQGEIDLAEKWLSIINLKLS